ncbi:hypothetical protein GCM10007160_03880 [Litchfieldella qijiaojingensis]|uniref:eCIS core domain-containing protein n=1 Tax=Litchfieldella qijiaojingensis TaxID=980347 RepID=A0ABQ2YD45_9GAMM|nr:DUF4157 domain-containing protein [Halomonas qijiaojingensis]GGX79720.1 hypothetical protein GCM10007160_03880 [Halomonas qijiaojingensis]
MERASGVRVELRQLAPKQDGVERSTTKQPLAPPSQPLMVQPKLWVGSSRDPLEREANRVADRVVSQVHDRQAQTTLSAPVMTTPPPVQRLPESEQEQEEDRDGDEEMTLVQRAADADPEDEDDRGEDATRPVQLKPAVVRPEPKGQPLETSLGKRIHGATQQRGRVLDASIREVVEAAMGLDLGCVRVHQDAEAATLSMQLRARAFTVGPHVFFGQNQYAPNTRAGLHLLSHELAHVQQQLGAQWVARDGEDVFPDREVPSSAIAVGLFGMDFHPEENSVYSGGPTRFEAMAIVLKRLLGTQYRRGIEQRVYDALERQNVSGFGRFSANSTAESGDPIQGPLHIDIRASNKLVALLEGEDFGFEVQLSEEERKRLALGLTSANLWPEVQPLMPAWYTEWIFREELSQQGELLRIYHRAAQSDAPGGESSRQEALGNLMAALYPPVELLEAIRQDVAIGSTDVEAGDALERNTRVHAVVSYVILWGISVEDAQDLQQAPAADTMQNDHPRQAKALMFLRYARTQPQLLEAGRSSDGHDARIEILGRFGRFLGHVGQAGRRTGEIMDHPARANAPAWNATLSVSPELLPPLFSAALETDHSFSMNLEFGHWTDAFALYGFLWERIRIPDPPEEESETAPQVPDVEQMAGERPSLGEVWDVRMRRTHRYNETDIERIREMTGVPFGTAAHDLVGINNILRITGTVLRFGFEWVTQPRNVRPIVFPEPGMYVIRCRAIPILEGDEEVVRMPSVAYQPVVAQDPTQMAIEQVEGTARTQFQARLRIAEIQGLLSAPFPPANAAELREEMEYLRTLLATPRQRLVQNVNDLAQQIRTIEERIRLRARIRALESAPEASRDSEEISRLRERLRAIGGPGTDWEDQRTLRRLRDQHETAVEMVGTREARVVDEEGVPMELMATFVSDLGHSVTLALETYDRGPVDGAREVFISDLTTPQSGIGTGRATHSQPASDEALRMAVELALTDLLETSSDYGRGRVAYRVGGSIHHLRVEAGSGRVLMEALEGASMVVSIGAIAAAPFTGGTSLYILLPVGLIGAAPSVYRLYERYQADTLRFDLQTAMDVVNIVGGMVGLAQVATPLRMVRLGRALMIMGIGADGAGILLMGAGVVQQIAALQNLPESERAARLLEILGNAMLQIGIMAGGSLAHARYQGRRSSGSPGDDTPGFHPPREGGEGTAGGRAGVEVDTPPTGERTMTGTGRPTDPPGTGTTATPRAGSADTQSPQRLLDRLGEGVDRSLPPPRPSAEVQNPPQAGTYRRRIFDADEAYTAYNEALEASAGREVAIYHDPETGEFLVRIGDEGSVTAPEAGWNALVHYHPNPGNVLTYRLPAPADFQGLMMRFFAEGGHVREFVEFDIPGVGRGRTEYGIEGGHSEPFYVRIHYPDGTERTVRFTHDGDYQVYWGSRTTHVAPGSPEYRAMIEDIQRYLRDRDPDLGSGPMRPTSERTSAGAGQGQRVRQLQDAEGNLTSQGIAFIRQRYRSVRDGNRRIPLSDLSDAELQQQFKNQPGWLESVVIAEVRASWLGRGSEVDFVMTNTRQDFHQIASRLQEAITAGNTGHSLHEPILSWNVRDFVLELVRQNDPVIKPLFDALQNHSDAQVRRRWHEFKYSTRAGDMYGFFLGEVGAKRPDVVEVLLSQNEIHITDATFAVGDPIHNFKSAFYRAVMERLINVGRVTATDYRAPMRQSPVGP